ncbi:MAG: hypothetical protein IBX62_02900 [Coriobacteriia bacterium]|nr:hypothetical protein [Coriobacteriia bacterium]
MARSLFGAFVILHGLIHLAWVTPGPDDPAYPFDLTRSPLLPRSEPSVLVAAGRTLVAVTVLAFTAAGLGLLGVPGAAAAWRVAAAAGALGSLALTALFWHRWFVAVPVLDAGILAAALSGWPSA